jgi:2-keto-3-deoxy-galactonokinase
MSGFVLEKPQLVDWFKRAGETGMGYVVVTAHLRDGRAIPQVVINNGWVTQVRGYVDVPFAEAEIASFEATHDKWDWSA